MVELGDVRLRHELDWVPLWRGDDVGVKQLTEDVAKYLAQLFPPTGLNVAARPDKLEYVAR